MSNAAIFEIDNIAMDDAFLSAGLADEAVFTVKQTGVDTPCPVILTRNVQTMGFDTRMASPSITIAARVADVGNPVRGDVFAVGAERFAVDALVDADESMVVLIVTRESA